MPPDAGRETVPCINLDSQTIQLAIVAAVALTMLLQTILLLAILVTLRKAARSMREDIEDLRSSVVPVIDNVKRAACPNRPQNRGMRPSTWPPCLTICAGKPPTSKRPPKSHRPGPNQTARMDSMLTSVFDAVDRAAGFMSDTVSKPMRQLAGILASAKAVVESLRTDVPGASSARRPGPRRQRHVRIEPVHRPHLSFTRRTAMLPLRWIVGLSVAALAGLACAQTTPNPALLILSKQNQTLAIVDPANLNIVARVPVGNDPHEVIASSDGATAYVSNYGFGAFHTIAVVDLIHQKPPRSHRSWRAGRSAWAGVPGWQAVVHD